MRVSVVCSPEKRTSFLPMVRQAQGEPSFFMTGNVAVISTNKKRPPSTRRRPSGRYIRRRQSRPPCRETVRCSIRICVLARADPRRLIELLGVLQAGHYAFQWFA